MQEGKKKEACIPCIYRFQGSVRILMQEETRRGQSEDTMTRQLGKKKKRRAAGYSLIHSHTANSSGRRVNTAVYLSSRCKEK